MHMPVLFSIPMMSVDMKAADTAAASLLREDKTHPNLLDVSRQATIYTTASDLQYSGTAGPGGRANALPPLKKRTNNKTSRSERPAWMRGPEEKTGFEPTEAHKLLRRYRVMYRGPQYSLIGTRQLVQMVRGPMVPAERLVHPTYSLVRGGTLVEIDARGGGGDGGGTEGTADMLQFPDSSTGTASATRESTQQTEPHPTCSATDATATAFLTEAQESASSTQINSRSTQSVVHQVGSGTRRALQWRLVKLPAKLRMRAETLRRHGEYTGKVHNLKLYIIYSYDI